MACCIENRDKEILLKFKNGGVVSSEEEERILSRYALTGWVCFGVDLEKQQAEAKLTKRGKWLVQTL